MVTFSYTTDGPVYDHGLPFDKTVGRNLVEGYQRVVNRTASFYIIDGGLGQGKTTLGVHLADFINSLLGLPLIELKGPQMAMGGLDFQDKLDACFEQKLPVILYDEGGDYDARRFLSNFNFLMNRILQTVRAYNCVVIMILPNFRILDDRIYSYDIVQGLFHLSGKIQGKYGCYKVYDAVSMQYMKDRMKKSPVPSTIYNFFEENFRGHFLDLSKERSDQLNEISTKMKREMKNKATIQYEGMLCYTDLASKLNKSILSTRKYVSMLKIKPEKRINKVAYFNKNAYDIIITHLDNSKRAGNF